MTQLAYQAMLEQMTDSIIFADKKGVIRFWNTASKKMFGFSAAEALGQSLDIIIPEKLRAPHWRGFYATVQSGKTKHDGKATRTKALHKNGEFIYAEVSFCLIKDEHGTVLGSLSSARPAAPKVA
ncbi:PAS domain S-box protein [Kingella kingae]|uniref:PAS domain-containing protein n=1 Tax=Kingella kingae TaxID=504 RepID=UPI0003F578EF|nr:PAS domain S-box protein [Kingella kingae]MDK4545011.1 PAS domain S-box protein [Kingella kingae]MDK4567104.1 PAS domain S-box protein [Kingella kingae]MDK4590200.1 PAS domain S-box protein [Kingella kingae]MDK4628797.1 PAS domain S-box protein [Kingella kingae]MDK4636720.1 PAS domain S-box protein [Kingella kingae]